MTVNNDSRPTVFDVHITVAFAAAREAFSGHYPSTTLASAVLERSLQAFEIATDGTSRYYLFHNGVEVASDQMIGALAEEQHRPHDEAHVERELHLKLRTETISGAG